MASVQATWPPIIERAAVFLDRDGTINRSDVVEGVPVPPKSVAELVLLPGVTESMVALKEAGFALVVFTNQPDVRRGSQSREAVEEIHQHLRATLPLDAVYCCYHDDGDGCTCRKPEPGMIIDAARHFRLDLASSYAVGDRWRDIEAGRRAGVTTILIRQPYSGRERARADFEVSDMRAACRLILEARKERVGEDLR